MDKHTNEVILDGYKCRPNRLGLGTAGSHGIEIIEIIRNELWAGMTVRATFAAPGIAPVSVLAVEDRVVVPSEATAQSVMGGTITYTGELFEDGEWQVRHSISQSYYVIAVGPTAGNDPIQPTPSILDQMLASERARETAERDRAAAEELRQETTHRAVQSAENAAEAANNAASRAEATLQDQDQLNQTLAAAEAARKAAEEAASNAGDDASAASSSATNAENAATNAMNALAGTQAIYKTMQEYVAQSVQDIQTEGDTQVQRVVDEGTAQTAAAKEQADKAQAEADRAEAARAKAEEAKTVAQSAKTAAEAAQGKAESAKTAAETAQSEAEAAQTAAETAAAEAAEYAGLTSGTWYGVNFSGSTSAGTRTGAAKNFVFDPATDTSEGRNDFDAVYPWAGMRRCCCTLNADGTVKVNAYKGQPGYIEDGTNGEVLVEVPLFYVKGMVDVDPKISMLPLPGYRAPRKFHNADGSLKQRCYLRAFPGYVGSDNKLHSVAGVVPTGNKTISAFLEAARQWGKTYCLETSADVEVMLYLMIVVYGTRNFQAKINGCVSLYATNIAITSAAESTNTVTTAAGMLQVGDVISIGTGGENESVAYRRIVTAVDGAVATFDGDPVTTTTDHKVWRIMQATGTANDVLGTCGSRLSNTDGKHSFIFYGLENPLYGNQWRFECDWKLIDGVPYYCDEPTKYQWSSSTDYTKLDTMVLPDEGWATRLQSDDRAPWLQIAAAVGGSSGTYLSDYFYINKSGVRIVLRGAASGSGGRAGPFYVYLSNDASWAGWTSGGDLSIPG